MKKHTWGNWADPNWDNKRKKSAKNTPTVPADPPLILKPDISPNGQADSVIRVNWCLDKSVAKKYQELNAQDVHVLVIVSHNGEEMDRYLCPIEQEHLFIRFRRPGLNTIHATTIRPNTTLDADKKTLKKYILQRENRHYYATTLLSHGGENIRSGLSSSYIRHPGEAQVQIEVPEEMFAKAPSRLGKAIIAFVFPRKRLVDECHYRRTLTYAVPLSLLLGIFIALKWLLMLLFTALLIFGGARNIDFSPLLRPRFLSPYQIQDNIKTSRWFHKKDGAKRHPVWWAINPPAFLAIAAIYLLGKLVSPVFIDTALLVLVFFGTYFFVHFFISPLLFGKNAKEKRAAREAKKQKERLATQQKKQQEKEAAYGVKIAAMACDISPNVRKVVLEKPVTIKLRLRYSALKAKVCRPYAK